VTNAHSIDARPAAERPTVLVAGDASQSTLPAQTLDFVQVFRTFGAYVPGLLRRLGVEDRDLEDVAQDVFTIIHRQLPGFRGDSSLKTWICGIALRVASSHRRKITLRRLLFADVDQVSSCAPEQFEAAELRERVLLLERALDRLSAGQRRVFVLYELEELSMREISQVLDCPEKTAYTRLYAARRAIERHLLRQAASGSST
jgi:RNA polymerase sigma-70 factor (ECF subfamily)